MAKSYKGLLPLNYRMGMRYLFDPFNRTITEKDLSKSDIKALGKLIYEARQGNNNTIQYKDYAKAGLQNDVWYTPDMVKQSFSNPLYRIGTTIGRATYTPTLNGYVVKDKYDFPDIELEEKASWVPEFRFLHDKFLQSNKSPLDVNININRNLIPTERGFMYDYKYQR